MIKRSILKKMFRKIFLIAIALLFASAVLAEVPQFTLPGLDGKAVSSSSYIGKKAVVLTFFTSWSKPCQEEMLFLRDLMKAYGEKGVEIVAVSLDKKLDGLRAFVSENKIGFDVLSDRKLKTLNDYKILILPTTFIIGKDGTISNTYVDFDGNIQEALKRDLDILISPEPRS